MIQSSNTPRVVIIGAGAMGSLFGFLLHRAGKDVWLLDKDESLAEQVRRHGLVVEAADGIHHCSLPITTQSADIGWGDLIVLSVKAYDTAQAAAAAKPLLRESSIILTVQNGIGNIENIVTVIDKKHIMAGITAQGATVLSPGRIRHAGTGETIVGELDGRITERLNQIRLFLDSAGIAVETTDDVVGLLWSKLLINAAINPLTGITGLQNGALLAHVECCEIMYRTVQEGQALAVRQGIRLIYPDAFAKATSVCAATAENISSMLQDLRNHKRTDIDFINGAIVQKGSELGVPTPVNAGLFHLVRIREAIAGHCSP